MTDFSEAGTTDQGLATPATKTFRRGPRQGLATPATKTYRWGPRQGLATPATKTYRWGPRQGLENRDYWMDCEAAF
jgi:hypothetical protein